MSKQNDKIFFLQKSAQTIELVCMSQNIRKTAEAERDLLEKQVQLIQEIDSIRDGSPDPSSMFSAITDLLSDFFSTDLCLICLVNRESERIELKAFKDSGNILQAIGPDTVQSLLELAFREEEPQIWEGKDILPRVGLQDYPSPLHIAAISVCMAQKNLGGILMARENRAFSSQEALLLRTAESQVDSAVIQAERFHELRQKNTELETIRRIDSIRDEHLPFDHMLTKVLEELHRVIQAHMSYIMLYEEPNGKLELKASSHDDLFQAAEHFSAVEQTSRRALESGTVVIENSKQGALHSIMCIPLILEDEIIGVLGMVHSHRPEGFNAEDRNLLDAIGSQMDTAIFESLEKNRLREVLGRAVDPRVMQRILDSRDMAFLKGERAEISVLYADIRGSTELAERSDPEFLVGFINSYLSAMTDSILSREGTLDKFVGDEVMALFGAPYPQEDHALRAVHTGVEMQKAHMEVMKTWKEKGFEGAPIGIGIATGELIAGEMGSPKRTDYTVIGRAANLGARICSAAEAGEVLVCEATHECVRDSVDAVPVTGLQLKGIGDDITVYRISMQFA